MKCCQHLKLQWMCIIEFLLKQGAFKGGEIVLTNSTHWGFFCDILTNCVSTHSKSLKMMYCI